MTTSSSENIEAATTAASTTLMAGVGEKVEPSAILMRSNSNSNSTDLNNNTQKEILKSHHPDKDDKDNNNNDEQVPKVEEEEEEVEDAMTTLLGISPDGMCLRHPHIRILMPEEEDDEGKNSFVAATGATLWHTCPICTSENRARHLHPRAKSYANVVKQVKQLQATPEFQAFIENWGSMPNHLDYPQGEEQELQQQQQQQGAVGNGGDDDDDKAEAYRIQRESLRTGQGESKHDSLSPQGEDEMELPPPPPPSDEGYEDSDDQMIQFHDAAEELASPPPPPPPLSSKQQQQQPQPSPQKPKPSTVRDAAKQQPLKPPRTVPSNTPKQQQRPPQKQQPPQPHQPQPQLRPLPRVLNVSAKDQVVGSMRSISTNSTRSLRLLEDPNVIWVDKTHLQSLLERMDQVHDWVLRQRDDELERLKRDNKTYQTLLMEREDEIRQLKNVVARHEKTIRHELKEIKRVAVMRQQQTAAAVAAASNGYGGMDGGSSHHNRSSGIVINHMKVEVNQSSDGGGMHASMSRDFSHEQLEHILNTTAHATRAALGGSATMLSPMTSPNPMFASPRPTPTPRTTQTTPASAKKAKSLSPERKSYPSISKPTHYKAPATMTEASMSFFSPQVTNRSSISTSYTSSKSPGLGSAGNASAPSLAPPSLADFESYQQTVSQMPSSKTSSSFNSASDSKRRSINTKAGPAAASAEALWADVERKRRASSSKEFFWDGILSGDSKKGKDNKEQERKRAMSLSPRLAQSRSTYEQRRSLDSFNASAEVIFIPTEQEVQETQKTLHSSLGEQWFRNDLSKRSSIVVAAPAPTSIKPKEEVPPAEITTNANLQQRPVKAPPQASPMPATRKIQPLPQPQQKQPPPTQQQQQQQEQQRPVYPRPPSRPRLPQITESPSLSSQDITEVQEEKKEPPALLNKDNDDGDEDDEDESITMGSNSETPPPNKTVTVDRQLQAKVSGLTLTTLEFNETMEASHGRIITKAKRELPMEQELDLDDSEPSQTMDSRKPSIMSMESFPSKAQASSFAVARRPSKEMDDDEEQSISVYSEHDALHYRIKSTPHVDDDEDEGSRFSASEASRRNQGSVSAGDGFVYQVAEEAIRDPYGDEGNYWGFMSAATAFPHGKGTMSYQNGRSYDGEWNHGRWHGHGRLVNPNGDTYDGEFDNDARHGYGCYKWANDNMYEGEFFEDKRHGKGTFTFSNGNVYKGDFVDGMFEGKGRYEFDEGFYEGEWKKGRYEGQGHLQYVDGSRHQGQFVGGVAHGEGEAVNSQGVVRRGAWENGKPV